MGNIPLPKWRMPEEADLLLKMSAGESVPVAGVAVSKCYEVAKALGMIITCRTTESGEYRLWRLL
jgi:hypothetical protein